MSRSKVLPASSKATEGRKDVLLPGVQPCPSVFRERTKGFKSVALGAGIRDAGASRAGVGQAVHSSLRRQLGLQTLGLHPRSCTVEERLWAPRVLEGLATLTPGLGAPVLEPHLKGEQTPKTCLGCSFVYTVFILQNTSSPQGTPALSRGCQTRPA
jgi:hypothetical protein